MTTSPCKHRFPVLPPTGSIFHPGDCTECGITYTAHEAELDQQAAAVRLHTTHEGTCAYCTKQTAVSQFQREAMPWDETDPPEHWLCPGCWNDATHVADGLTYSEISAALDNPNGSRLARFVYGGTA